MNSKVIMYIKCTSDLGIYRLHPPGLLCMGIVNNYHMRMPSKSFNERARFNMFKISVLDLYENCEASGFSTLKFKYSWSVEYPNTFKA